MGLYLGATELSTGGGGGGGGFTKMNKYSTARALNDANFKLATSVTGVFQTGTKPIGTTTFTDFQVQGGVGQTENALVGSTFVFNATTHTITSNSTLVAAVNGTIVFTPGLTASMAPFTNIVTTPSSFFTVNPATDLGLSDGASIGYFMVASGGTSGNGYDGAYGGKILMGTAIITTASTNLVLTPGASAESTISGGLTLTTGNGSNHYGHRGNSQVGINGGVGINGYGAGCVGWGQDLGQYSPVHGFGKAVSYHSTMVASDGAILLFY